MKRTLAAIILSLLFFSACEPERGTVDDKEAVKNDTLDSTEGKGEGEVGEGVYGR